MVEALNLLPVRFALNIIGLILILAILYFSRVKAAICLGAYFLTGVMFRCALINGYVTADGDLYELLITIDLLWIVLAAFFILQGIRSQIRRYNG